MIPWFTTSLHLSLLCDVGKTKRVRWRELGCTPMSLYFFIIQPVCSFLCSHFTSSVSVSPCLSARLSRVEDAHCTTTQAVLRISLSSLFFPGVCTSALRALWSNSWLREIWWKVSRPVFTPSQMALNKLGEKTQIHFSYKGFILGLVASWDLVLFFRPTCLGQSDNVSW